MKGKRMDKAFLVAAENPKMAACIAVGHLREGLCEPDEYCGYCYKGR